MQGVENEQGGNWEGDGGQNSGILSERTFWMSPNESLEFDTEKGLSETPNKHQHVFSLKIWSTIYLKRYNFIVFKMKGVL